MADRCRDRGVLISASATVSGKSLTISGSGFVAWSPNTTLVTSANWMRNVLRLRLSDESVDASRSHLEWKLSPSTNFFVHHRPRGSDKLERNAAAVVSVCLMPDVFRTLRNLWLESHDLKSRDGHEADLLRSLLYPSSVVVLKCAPAIFDSASAVVVAPLTTLHSGNPLLVVATPFGHYFPSVFLNSVSYGCLSGCHGDSGCVFVMDAHCVRGCEGGIVQDGTRTSADEPLVMVGMVVSCLSVDGMDQQKEALLPSGLTLASSMTSVINSIKLSHPAFSLSTDQAMLTDHFGVKSPSVLSPVEGCVVCVVSGNSWGSGVLLTTDVILTCAHVLQGNQGHVTVRWPGNAISRTARVIYKNPPDCAPDLALLRLIKKAPAESPPLLEIVDKLNSFVSETVELAGANLPVVAIGYCAQDPVSCSGRLSPPLVTRGIVSNLIRHSGVPVMLQTSAGIHRGMSGGLLCDGKDGQPLGLLVSCARIESSQCLLPNIGFAVPFSWIGKPVLEFLESGDLSLLQSLGNPEVSSLWNLKPSMTTIKSKL